MLHRFHVEEIGDWERVRLPRQTVHHLHVLGLSAGSEVVLFDGTGCEVLARIESMSSAEAQALILRRTHRGDPQTQSSALGDPREASLDVTIACAVPKGRRMDTLVRACAELGVGRIVPLITRRSVVKPGERSRGPQAREIASGDLRPSRKMDRWRKICVAASEQSGRNRITSVEPPATLPDFLKRTPDFDLAVILSPEGSAATLASLLAPYDRLASLVILVGPEGGFTDEELELAARHGLRTARLTRSILRVETACIAAAAVALMHVTA